MTWNLTVEDVHVDLWYRDGGGATSFTAPPDATLSGDEIYALEYQSRAGEVMDEGDIIMRYPEDDRDLNFGDRLEITTTLAAPSGAYGIEYGILYGGVTFDVTWTAHVNSSDRTTEHVGSSGNALHAELTDWVGGNLSDRKVTGSWVDTDVGQVIRDIVARKCPEVDASNVPDFGRATDQFFQNENAWDLVTGLAALADALVFQDGMELHAAPLDGIETWFDLTPEDYALPWKTQIEDEVHNSVRVDSGESRQPEEENLDQTGFTTISSDTRFTHRLRARKSQVHSITLYVEKRSDADLKLRLQADEGGEPVEIANEDSDVAQASWPGDDLPGEGFRDLFFEDHTLPDRDPWLIIETSAAGEGENDEQGIGIDSGGTLIFQSFYPHPVNFRSTDGESVGKYGLREVAVERDNLKTLTAARDAAEMELRRRARPPKFAEFGSISPRAHALVPGDAVAVDNPDEDAEGQFIVTERSQVYDSETVLIDTDITATWRRGILAEI